MASQVRIDLGKRSYDIYIGYNLLNSIGARLKGIINSNKVMLVTNPTVAELYAKVLHEQLESAGMYPVMAEIPDGEEYKNLATAEKLYDIAYEHELDRQTPIIALGGGVVGDLAGFVAATYLRGVPFIQIPTTLLAQVDSSVGGKVAVNHPKGKNIIGAFYQPAAVFADLSVIKTLPDREIKAGMAEVVKYGVISDGLFFNWLEENLEKVLTLEPQAMEKVVTVSCKCKAAVVKEDETEKGARAILNFGHTVGHAIEALTGYKTYRHGEAVSIGMAAAAEMAVNMGMLNRSEAIRINRLLQRIGLPVNIPPEINIDDLIKIMQKDKKVISSKLTFVLPVSIGKVEIVRGIGRDVIAGSLAASF